MSRDKDDGDAGHLHRRGTGHRSEVDHGSAHPPIPGRATMSERLPPSAPTAAARRPISAAAGVATRIEAMTPPLRNALEIADVGPVASQGLGFLGGPATLQLYIPAFRSTPGVTIASATPFPINGTPEAAGGTPHED